jgi:cytochrome b subunit of formate dehydrogenase
MDYLFRYATSVYGQQVLLGANWGLFWWFVAAGAAFILLHALTVPFLRRRVMRGAAGREAARGAAAPLEPDKRVVRHLLADRLFHWTLAASVLILLVTAFGPVLGWQFDWVPIHWITGVVLIAVILFHIVRALISLDFWSMMPDLQDLANAWRAAVLTLGGRAETPGKPGKYPLMQKLYHWGIAGWILVLVATGGLMLAKIDTPFWQRNPYFLSDFEWGIVYTIHDFFALGLLTLVMMHVYFAVRPDKIFLLRSMILGWMTRRDYRDNHDPRRWAPDSAESD